MLLNRWNVLLAAGLALTSVSLAVAQSRTYTLDADFDEGVLFNVEHETVHNQLQLTTNLVTRPYMWISNAGEDTVSKWNTDTNREEARYNTWFGPPANHDAWTGPSPSRTAVDAEGNCYVANRHFDNRPADVLKILNDGFIDRNGNGVMDTSFDVNGNGIITPDEMLPMTDVNGNGIIDADEIRDERVAWVVRVGNINGLGRSLAIDGNGCIWVGLFNQRAYYKLSGETGQILAGPISVSASPYGALVDRDGILWGATLGTSLIRLDTNTNAVQVLNHSAHGSNYGVALGRTPGGRTIVYLGNLWNSRVYIEYNTETGVFRRPAALSYGALGIATDSFGNILAGAADTSRVGGLGKFAPDGSLIWWANAQVASEARGTIVDNNNDVWVLHRATNQMSKFRGSDGAHLGVFNCGRAPYTYSDATGLGRITQFPLGTWTVVYDSGLAQMPWGTISWNSIEPAGTSVTVRARSSDDNATWSGWEPATNGVSLGATPNGRYVQVETTLRVLAGNVSPVLEDLTITAAPRLLIDIYPNRLPNSIYLSKNYTIYVAVLGSAGFDVNALNWTTVKFGRTGTEASPVRMPILRDLNGDGFADAMYGFLTYNCGFQLGDTSGILRGTLTNAMPVLGTDSVAVSP